MEEWELFEHIAGVIEASLSPGASVSRNVKLPVLGSKRTRQCDLVIRYGREHRETLAIVEIQKRKRKPDIGTFHAWYAKMRAVGAKHLLCVSSAGFPQSIIDEVATRIGPTVRLLTLSDLENASELDLRFELIHKYPDWEFTSVGPLVLAGDDEEMRKRFPILYQQDTGLKTNAECFFLEGDPHMKSLNTLMAENLQEVDDYNFLRTGQVGLRELAFSFGGGSSTLWFVHGNDRAIVKDLFVTVVVKNKFSYFPMHTLCYKQQDVGCTLAWVAYCIGKAEGRSFRVNLVYTRDERGILKCRGVESSSGLNLRQLYFDTEEDAEEYSKALIDD